MTIHTQDTVLILEALDILFREPDNVTTIEFRKTAHDIFDRLQELRKVKEAELKAAETLSYQEQILRALQPDPLTGVSPLQEALKKTVLGGQSLANPEHRKNVERVDAANQTMENPTTEPELCPACGERVVEMVSSEHGHYCKCDSCGISTVFSGYKDAATNRWNTFCHRIKERMK